jgi:tRNA (mo5U34)-methyltransferase
LTVALFDPAAARQLLEAVGLQAWAAEIGRQIDARHLARPHGDSPRWERALADIPPLGPGRVAYKAGAVDFSPMARLSVSTTTELHRALMSLRPWRKGPYRFGGLFLDSEWRSDWKWERVRPHVEPLRGRLVLDVGCGNGYFCWLMALAGARAVIGLDPTALYLAQFAAVSRVLAQADGGFDARTRVLPLGVEDLPAGLGAFDTVFSMGLRPGGQLVLETLVVEGGADRVLVPRERYAKMRNVWFIPSVGMLETWLRRCGFRSVVTVDVTPTTTREQRATAWMDFESLADFLDPRDQRQTIEGYPAPRRAVCTALA